MGLKLQRYDLLPIIARLIIFILVNKNAPWKIQKPTFWKVNEAFIIYTKKLHQMILTYFKAFHEMFHGARYYAFFKPVFLWKIKQIMTCKLIHNSIGTIGISISENWCISSKQNLIYIASKTFLHSFSKRRIFSKTLLLDAKKWKWILFAPGPREFLITLFFAPILRAFCTLGNKSPQRTCSR